MQISAIEQQDLRPKLHFTEISHSQDPKDSKSVVKNSVRIYRGEISIAEFFGVALESLTLDR